MYFFFSNYIYNFLKVCVYVCVCFFATPTLHQKLKITRNQQPQLKPMTCGHSVTANAVRVNTTYVWALVIVTLVLANTPNNRTIPPFIITVHSEPADNSQEVPAMPGTVCSLLTPISLLAGRLIVSHWQDINENTLIPN